MAGTDALLDGEDCLRTERKAQLWSGAGCRTWLKRELKAWSEGEGLTDKGRQKGSAGKQSSGARQDSGRGQPVPSVFCILK